MYFELKFSLVVCFIGGHAKNEKKNIFGPPSIVATRNKSRKHDSFQDLGGF